MKFTRREFIQGGVTAFTVGFAAPAFLSDIALAQGASRRNLVVLYLSGGNDALSTLIPYQDQFYYSRRPTIAVPAGTVLQVGTDSSGKALGLHPRLVGLHQIFNQGRLAIVQRTGYQSSSRSHFLGTDIWSTANPKNSAGTGWLGRYLDTLPSPVDPLAGWSTVGVVPHSLLASRVSVPGIPNPTTYALQSPNPGVGQEPTFTRSALTAVTGFLPADRPHLAFVNGTAQGAISTLDRVLSVTTYVPTVTYANDGLSQALRTVAAAMVRSIGTKVFWVQIGGFDNHAGQGTTAGTYFTLMNTLNAAITSFYNDLSNQGLLQDTMMLQFSEFGRRISENGSFGTDHGAAAIMMAIGGGVTGGLYGTAPSLNPNGNPTLENNNGDVTYETDFRAVYARVLDNWLGVDSVGVLGGNFRKPSLTFV